MGKRKERRLAAMSATNRRVKLDLFADPNEEAMCNSVSEEVGVNQDQDNSASAPSPSSSGQNKENPLLLLGQYSDDELDDEANKMQKDANNVDYSTGSEEKEQALASEDLGNNDDEVIEASTCNQELNPVSSPKELKASDADAIEPTFVDIVHCETESTAQPCEPEPSENQANGHVDEHWKLVLHEESNQYYYWNTVTGETSWEVPAALVVDTQNTDEQSLCTGIEERVANAMEGHTFADANVDMGIHGQVPSADEHETSNLISKDSEGHENIKLETTKAIDSGRSIGQNCNDSVTASYSSLSEYSNLSDHVGLNHALNNEEKDANMSKPGDRHASEDDHASELIQYGEALLQRLDMLYRSARRVEGYEGIRKEIDIRILDCRALSSYGSSLLPFWWHIDAQLKQIESAIDTIEAVARVQSEEFRDLIAEQIAPQEASYSEVIEKDNKIIDTSEFGNDMTKNEHQPEIVPESNAAPDSSYSAPAFVDNGDDDMDVEMEVDEEMPSAPTSITAYPTPSEQFIQANWPLSQCPPSMLPNESNVAPLPEEEWIPPPPPELEPLPPPLPPPECESDPPPEEQPSATFPPPYAETMIYPFPDQYNVGYHIPAYGYYSSSVTEVSNGNYYGIAGSSQFGESEPPPAYYEPIAPSALPDAASSVTSVGSAVYYDVANVSISSGPVLSGTDPSAFYVESGAVNYQDLAPVSVHSSVADVRVDSVGNYLLKASKESQISTLKASSNPSTVQAQAIGASSGNDSNLDSQTLAASKNQSKAARGKKRAVAVVSTLRSNKKVSSLVDKWKAAKEELHEEEEEEPENALEILEKKRQKEIEQWRARQVATGEAQDNANFVPLGGDWRERVKRRRGAEVRAEDAQTSTTAAAAEKEKKQPDLLELSKDLPSGWQAYWDDSTKQVYYGNRATSETTWERPAR